jgi:hypothetical protein
MGEGTVRLITDDSVEPLKLTAALHAPGASGNLISVGWLQTHHGTATYGKDHYLSVVKHGRAYITGHECLYEISLLASSLNDNVVCLYSGMGQKADLTSV